MSRLTIQRITSRCIEDGDCLLWTGKLHTNGSPSATEWVGGKDHYVAVRRRAYEEYHGVTLRPAQKVTSCGHPACLAKAHLEIITVAERGRRAHANMDAATRLRRGKKLSQIMRAVKGKISPEVVAAIRNSDEGPYVMGRKLGVTGSVASRIKRGLSYKDYEANPFSGLGA